MAAMPLGRRPRSATQAIVGGTLVVGTLDILDAIIFYGVTKNVPAIQIWQSIASGLLGRSAFHGGLLIALLGGLLHYFIAFAIVTTFYAASRKAAILARHWIAAGIAYGLGVYAFMTYVVVPLSAAHGPRFSVPVLLNGLLGHVLLIGLPSAWFARRAA